MHGEIAQGYKMKLNIKAWWLVKWAMISTGNGLLLIWHQAITWTSDDLQSIQTYVTNLKLRLEENAFTSIATVCLVNLYKKTKSRLENPLKLQLLAIHGSTFYSRTNLCSAYSWRDFNSFQLSECGWENQCNCSNSRFSLMDAQVLQ